MKKAFLLTSVFLAFAALTAADADATKAYEEGYKLYAEGEYYDASKKFEEAEIEADDTLIRSNALRAQIGAWRMCELPYREFEAIEKLITNYPEYSDLADLAKREYEIAELYYSGKREPAFYALRWIPWLHDGDHSVEIYRKALERAPFSDWAPAARLRLAYILDRDGDKPGSVAELEKFVADYPSSELYKYALLSLANGYMDLSEKGDGDGHFIGLCYEKLQEFQKKYPDAEENEWVSRQIVLYRDAQAQRLYDLAEFYQREGRSDASQRYLAKVIVDYPDSKAAPESEKMMVELDRSFIPDSFSTSEANRLPTLKAYDIPAEATRTLLVPGQNGNHFLLPVPDYAGDLNAAYDGGKEQK